MGLDTKDDVIPLPESDEKEIRLELKNNKPLFKENDTKEDDVIQEFNYLNYLHSIQINLTLDNVLITTLAIVLISFIIFVIYKMAKVILNKKFKIVDMNINIANIGNVSIEMNKDISKIAHKAWVEIMTRKVGLLYEEDKDVIC